MTAPTPSNNAPATTTARIICRSSVLRSASKRRPANALGAGRGYPAVELPARHFIPAPGKISEAMPALVLADRDPDPLGGRRHIDVVDPVFAPQPLDDGVHHRRTGADRTGLARALDAERVGLARDVMGLEYK